MSYGVAILVKNASYYNLIDTCKDDKGRLIVLTLTIDEVAIQLASVYAPDRPYLRSFFFDKLRNKLCPQYLTVMGGDFNMVEDIAQDRRGGRISAFHKKGLAELLKIKEEFNLIDIRGENNRNAKEYTWKSPDGTIRSRLDRFYDTKTLQNQFAKSENYPCVW